jgi:hypothetical protein
MKTSMKVKISLVFILMCTVVLFSAQKELKNDQIPADVVTVLNQYLDVLSKSGSVEDAAKELIKRDLVAGHLTTSDKSAVASDVKEFSLKKDFENVKFYIVPAVITRAVLIADDYDGFRDTLFEGDRYKIWIKKKEGVAGLPAPIPVIKPKKGTPKIVSTIGSL